MAGVVYLVLGVPWALASGVPSAVLWFLGVAVVGAFIPGPANQVSLARAYLAAPAVVYGTEGVLGYLAVVVALASLTDLVDGTIARRFSRPSTLGGGLDPVVDGVFMGGVVIGLSMGGTFPVWLALVVIGRYLLPALAGGALIAAGRRPELRHTLTGQVSTTLILVLLGGICLFRGLHQDASRLVSAAEVVIPLATIATFIHLAWASREAVAAPEPG